MTLESIPLGIPLKDTSIAIYNDGSFEDENKGEIFIGGVNRVCYINKEATGR